MQSEEQKKRELGNIFERALDKMHEEAQMSGIREYASGLGDRGAYDIGRKNPHDHGLNDDSEAIDLYPDKFLLRADKIRKFDTGATRDTDQGKLDFEGFDSPLVNKRYAQYMHAHRLQADGSLRSADNWQKGIPKEAYVKSLIRHVEDVKLHWDGYGDEATDPELESALCAVMFNIKGLLFEILKEKRGKEVK